MPRTAGTSDGAWDAPWRSRAQRTDYGWSAEIAIPLTSIQYRRRAADVTWGINFGRSRRRSLERTFWAGPVDYWARLSMAGTLVGLDIPQQSRRRQVIPYALGRAQEREPAIGGGRTGRALRRHPATIGVRHGQSRLRHDRGPTRSWST